MTSNAPLIQERDNPPQVLKFFSSCSVAPLLCGLFRLHESVYRTFSAVHVNEKTISWFCGCMR
jgi:hypothetical protein